MKQCVAMKLILQGKVKKYKVDLGFLKQRAKAMDILRENKLAQKTANLSNQFISR